MHEKTTKIKHRIETIIFYNSTFCFAKTIFIFLAKMQNLFDFDTIITGMHLKEDMRERYLKESGKAVSYSIV